MSTSVLEALPGKLNYNIKSHSPNILYISASLAMSTSILEALPGKLVSKDTHLVFSISASLAMSTSVLEALPGKLYIKKHSPSILYISASLAMSTSVLKPCLLNFISKHTHQVFSISRQASRCQQAFS